jgi:hypothetical protein
MGPAAAGVPEFNFFCDLKLKNCCHEKPPAARTAVAKAACAVA